MKRLMLAAAFLASSCASAPADRTIDITMRDNAFSPKTITVDRGETVELRFTNRGKVTHDAFIGDEAEQRSHEDEMQEHGDHGEDEGLSVASGETGTLRHTFDEEGAVEIGCHQPGHYTDGMITKIRVR